jgi:hypothetical protein
MSRRARFLFVSAVFLVVLLVSPFVVYNGPSMVSYWERMGDGLVGYLAFAIIVAALVFGVLRLFEMRRRPI